MTGAAHTQGYLASGIPVPENIPEISPACAFKKSSNFKDLRKISPISPISPGCRGCVSRAVKTLSHAWTFAPSNAPQRAVFCPRFVCGIRPHPRNPRNPREIHKISTRHETLKSAQMLAFVKISTISTKSTPIFGCRGFRLIRCKQRLIW